MSLQNEPLLSFRNITKRFGSVVANSEVSFSVLEGTIHGVVGENGAGKSTIMKMLYGMFLPDHGEIYLRGRSTLNKNPQEAIALGIGMVHQHFMLVPTLTAWENMILGVEPSLGFLKKKAILEELETLKKEFGFQVDLTARVEALPVGHQQQVELLKLLYRKAELLILDEPTAVLTPQEVESLFEKLKALKQSGKTVVVITHKLKEILQFTDHVTVMRQGKAIETLPTRTLTEESLAEKMIGHKRFPLNFKSTEQSSRACLQVASLSLKPHQGHPLHQISFEVKAGEILGIAGIEGNGQKELIECIAGVERGFSGAVIFGDKNILDCSAYELKQHGFSIIPPDRLREAVVPSLSLIENSILGHHKEKEFQNGFFVSESRTRTFAKELIHQFDIRPANPDLDLSSLSGGNQQKLVVARETSRPTKLLIAAHPTRGIDIGAIDFIHQHFLELRSQGTGILLISSELDEIIKLSDRILVMFQGKIVSALNREDATEREIGLRMTGSTQP